MKHSCVKKPGKLTAGHGLVSGIKRHHITDEQAVEAVQREEPLAAQLVQSAVRDLETTKGLGRLAWARLTPWRMFKDV